MYPRGRRVFRQLVLLKRTDGGHWLLEGSWVLFCFNDVCMRSVNGGINRDSSRSWARGLPSQRCVDDQPAEALSVVLCHTTVVTVDLFPGLCQEFYVYKTLPSLMSFGRRYVTGPTLVFTRFLNAVP